MSFGRCGFVAVAVTGFLLLGSIERLQHVQIVLDQYSTVTLDFNEHGVATSLTNREPVQDSSRYLVSPSRSHLESHLSTISSLEGRLSPLIQVRDTIPASFPIAETIDTYRVRARVFGLWNASRDALPCYEPELDWKQAQNQASSTGFLFVKPYKTGSSTAAGVNLRSRGMLLEESLAPPPGISPSAKPARTTPRLPNPSCIGIVPDLSCGRSSANLRAESCRSTFTFTFLERFGRPTPLLSTTFARVPSPATTTYPI
jgi:hypothetical protein